MKSRLKHFLSLFLSLLIIMQLISTTAFANTEINTEGINEMKWNPESNTMDIKQVLAGVNNGGNSKYSNYRIPGIVATHQDTIIMYCEARTTGSDWAPMDILAFRSTDGGETWGEAINLAAGADIGKTMNNPIMIVGNDKDNTLHFLYCVEYGVCTECGTSATSSCTHGPGVYYRKSTDDGLTWSAPVNITDSTNPDMHNVIATGPGHGIALSNGTLIATIWLVKKEDNSELSSHHPGNVSTLYSTDNGATWQMGDIIPNDNTDGSAVANPNETMAVECSDGSVMLNIRSGGGGYRALAWSPNGYSNWTTMEYDTSLIDPTCMGTVNKFQIDGYPYTILLANCENSSARENLVLKGSVDDGKNWIYRKVIEPNSAGYSDVTVDSKGTIYVLYEVNYGTTVNLARLNYNCLVGDINASLSSLEVEGLDDTIDFNANTFEYTLKANYGDTVTINAIPYQPDAQITVNGENYTADTDYEYEFKMGDKPIEIKVSYGEYVKTYTVSFKLSVPSGTMVMHLNGETYKDQTPYQNNAVASSTVSLSSQKSAFGTGSYAFSGNKSRIDISPTNGIDVATENFTVSTWAYFNTLTSQHGNQQIIFWYGSYGTGKPQFWCRSRNSDLQCCISSGGKETVLTALNVLTTNSWNHIVIIRDGLNFYLYLNDELVASAVCPYSYNINGDDCFTIGRAHSTDGYLRQFNGYMDELKLFNYGLSAEQIHSLYTTNTLPKVAVKGVSLDKSAAHIAVGDTLTIKATLNPVNADEKGIIWTSLDNTVATVNKYGKVTALKSGSTAITATTVDGSYNATCDITVHNFPEYMIYQFEPTKMGQSTGTDVTGTLPDRPVSAHNTFIGNDGTGSYYSTSVTAQAENTISFIDTGYTEDNFALLGNPTVLNKLLPYMQISIDVRVTSDVPIPQRVSFNISGTSDTNAALRYANGTVLGDGKWHTFTLSGTNGSVSEDYQSMLAVTLSNPNDCPIKFEFRKFTVSLNINDTETINNLLKGTGYSYESLTAYTDYDINDDGDFNLIDLIRLKKIVGGTHYIQNFVLDRLNKTKTDYINAQDLKDIKVALLKN